MFSRYRMYVPSTIFLGISFSIFFASFYCWRACWSLSCFFCRGLGSPPCTVHTVCTLVQWARWEGSCTFLTYYLFWRCVLLRTFREEPSSCIMMYYVKKRWVHVVSSAMFLVHWDAVALIIVLWNIDSEVFFYWHFWRRQPAAIALSWKNI